MFGRRILAAAAFVVAVSAAQLTITNPSSTSWWVAGEQNTVAWTCGSSGYSAYTIVMTNTNTSILSAPLALVSNIPDYDCSFTVSAQQSTLAPSSTWTIELCNIQNLTDVYASVQFTIEPNGSPYPSPSSSASSGTSTGSASSPSSTSSSSKNGALANYIPVGMSMAAAAVLGLVVA